MTQDDADRYYYYRQLCEHLGMAVISTDVDLTIRTWNLAAARAFGAAADRMIGTPIIQMIPQNRRKIAERMLRRTIATGETIQFEFTHRDAHGERRELAGTIAPVVVPSSTDDGVEAVSGNRVGASLCIRDITERLGLMDELHENRKMASLGEMAGAIAHHFNNIFGGIVTSIDYAEAAGDTATKTRVLAQIGGAVQRATTLVSGLLAFAEGDRRADDMSDLTEIVRQVAHETELSARQQNIEFTLSMPELPALSVPRVQTATVLRNLAQNAIEAMPNGGSLQFDVSLMGESIVMLVEDTGCGLDESAKTRIFEPFWSTKGDGGSPAGSGTGLGLAIVHGLIQMMNGTISVTSRPGQGACFRITLPRPSGD